MLRILRIQKDKFWRKRVQDVADLTAPGIEAAL